MVTSGSGISGRGFLEAVDKFQEFKETVTLAVEKVTFASVCCISQAAKEF